MMVDRRHPKETAATGQLEEAHLQDHRDELNDEDDADHWQQECPAGLECQDCQTSPERQRAGVSHEHTRRVDIEPEVREERTDKRRRDDRWLLETCRECQPQVARVRGERRSTRQTVEAVDLVDTRSAAKNHERGKGYERPSKIERQAAGKALTP